MAKVTFSDSDFSHIHIVDAFTTHGEAQKLACEVFTCAIIAIARGEDGIVYMRPEVSKDKNIFAYAVINFMVS